MIHLMQTFSFKEYSIPTPLGNQHYLQKPAHLEVGKLVSQKC